jgi:hypothetical protein
MKSPLRLVILLSLILAADRGAAQRTISEVQLPPPTNWVQTGLAAVGVTSPIACGSPTGVYFRQLVGKESWTFTPITVLLPDGKSKTIDLRAASNFQEPVIGTTFNVDTQGNIYAAIQIGRSIQWYVAKYDKSGTFIHKIVLPKRFMPFFLLPISGDRVLTGGTFSRSSGEETRTKSLVAIFDREGNQLNSLSLPGDDSNEIIAKEPNVKQIYYSVSNPTIEAGKAVLADDGNIYVLRASDKPVVQVIRQEDGIPLRTFELEPAGHDMLPSEFLIYKDSIAVGYFISKSDKICPTKGFLILYGRQAGDVVMRYLVQLAPPLFVCVQDRQLVYFQGSKEQSNYHIARVAIPAVEHEAQVK